MAGPTDESLEIAVRLLSPEIALSEGARIGVAGRHSEWQPFLREASGPRGSVSLIDLQTISAPIDSEPYDEIFLIDCWSKLDALRATEARAPLELLLERVRPGGRLWVLERRNETTTRESVSWSSISAELRRAGFTLRSVDINRLDDHLFVQVERPSGS
ncbi:MAG: hypothetical protein RL885_13965 [Planctomycetota bacterium]